MRQLDPRARGAVNAPAVPAEGHLRFRPALRSDAGGLTGLVEAAYGPYAERIGMLPRPMIDDYDEVIRDDRVTVAERSGTIVGVIALRITEEGFLIDNVAVHPTEQGKGLGTALLRFAEAQAHRAGFDSVYLYTHEAMVENIGLYSRLGYEEFDRRSQGSFSLVYMRKPVGAYVRSRSTRSSMSTTA